MRLAVLRGRSTTTECPQFSKMYTWQSGIALAKTLAPETSRTWMAGEKTVTATLRDGVCWTLQKPCLGSNQDVEQGCRHSPCDASTLPGNRAGRLHGASLSMQQGTLLYAFWLLSQCKGIIASKCIFAFIEPSVCLQLASSLTFPPTSASETNPKILPRSLPTISMSLSNCQDNSLC